MERKQTAKEGYVLTNGDGLYVKSIDLGIEAPEWMEIPEEQMPEEDLLQLYESELNELEDGSN